jgi:DNA repair protein RecO (recombination protein O)
MRPRAQPFRRNDQPAFVLHAYPYRETSLIVEAFTRDFGRVAVVARGAKRPRSELRGLLQGFQPLFLSWSGQQELKTLLKAEWRGGLPRVGGAALLCGFYLNELLLKLLPREDPHPDVFADYETALGDLAAGRDRGPRRTSPSPGERLPIVRGTTLLALAEHRYPDAATAAEAKRLMRDVLDHYLEQRGVESRRVVQDLQALEDEMGSPHD